MNSDIKVLEELKSGNKDLKWYSKNYQELKKKYSNKFIAIKDQNVVFNASKLDILLKHLRDKFGNPKDFLIDFVPDDNYILAV